MAPPRRPHFPGQPRPPRPPAAGQKGRASISFLPWSVSIRSFLASSGRVEPPTAARVRSHGAAVCRRCTDALRQPAAAPGGLLVVAQVWLGAGAVCPHAVMLLSSPPRMIAVVVARLTPPLYGRVPGNQVLDLTSRSADVCGDGVVVLLLPMSVVLLRQCCRLPLPRRRRDGAAAAQPRRRRLRPWLLRQVLSYVTGPRADERL